MADQQLSDTTPLDGMPDQTRSWASGEGEPPTAALPGRWSGAAMVPDAAPRRSLWSRMVDRFAGTPAADPDDDRTAIPAVDPWADQDTPAWPDAFTTPPVDPARFEALTAPAPTRLDAPAPRPARQEPPAPPAGRNPAARHESLSARAARYARLPRPRQEASAGQSGQGLPGLDTRPGSTAATTRVDPPAHPATAAGPSDGRRLKPGQESSGGATSGGEASRFAIPAPGTYPPPTTGSGLPPLLPPKVRAWGRRAAAKSQQATAATPERLRSWGQQAAAKGQQAATEAPGRVRSWGRRSTAPATPTRIPPRARPSVTPPAVHRPPVPPPRRRPRRLRRFLLLTVVALVLCGGGPLALQFLPGGRQYPVTAVLPESFADLRLRDTAAGERAAQRLAEQLQSAGADGDAFAGVYTDTRGKRVTVFGATGLRLTPGSDVQTQLDRLTEALALKNLQSFDTGEFGAHQQCGTGRLDGAAVVACTWADHGSLATVLLTRRSLEESAELVARLRTTVLVPA